MTVGVTVGGIQSMLKTQSNLYCQKYNREPSDRKSRDCSFEILTLPELLGGFHFNLLQDVCERERNLVKHHVHFHVPKEVLEKHQLISDSNFKTKLQLCFCNRKADIQTIIMQLILSLEPVSELKPRKVF